jgi:hypothetical protein
MAAIAFADLAFFWPGLTVLGLTILWDGLSLLKIPFGKGTGFSDEDFGRRFSIIRPERSPLLRSEHHAVRGTAAFAQGNCRPLTVRVETAAQIQSRQTVQAARRSYR